MDDDFGLLEGFIYDKDNLVILAASEKLEEDGVDHAIICTYRNGDWDFWYEEFLVVKVCIFEGIAGPALMMMGANGEIKVFDANGFKSEIIDATEEAPSILRQLNDIRHIENHIYVTGMRRQVYKRPINAAIWERCDKGVLVPSESKEVAGFVSIDGFSDSEIYGVGFDGQIWHFNGKSWHEVNSPTNMLLESVRCVDNKFVIIVGNSGVILKGRGDIWEVIEQQVTRETLIDVETVSGSIYISTEVGIIYKLEGTELIPVDTGFDTEITTGNLHSDGKTLLSVGERHLLLFDGIEWTEIPNPPLPPI